MQYTVNHYHIRVSTFIFKNVCVCVCVYTAWDVEYGLAEYVLYKY